MRATILTICLIALTMTMSCQDGRKTEAVAVPLVVINSFNNQYPQIHEVNWEAESKSGAILYFAEFNLDGKNAEVKYDEKGKFIDMRIKGH